MSSSSGESLAFGPGLHSSQVLPGDIGNSLIAAHRDTHFADIQSLQMGELIRVENSSGVFLTFEIDDIRVVDSRLEVPVLESDISRVTLISCYPFDSSVKDPPLRFLVSAKRVV
nr:class D sortase [Pleionea sp. CnH1-48]